MDKLKKYLHHFVGCMCKIEKQFGYDDDGKFQIAVKEPLVIMSPHVYSEAMDGNLVLKPILRPVSSITDQERFELEVYQHSQFKKLRPGVDYNIHKTTIVQKWYMDKCFDVFNLIEQDLAIDATMEEEQKVKATHEKY